MGGALLTISGSVTVSSAAFADSVSFMTDFHIVPEKPKSGQPFPGTLTVDPNISNTDSVHTWDYEEQIDVDAEIDAITVDYPTGTGFDTVGTGDVTVQFLKSPPGDLREVTVNSITVDGSSATFDIDPTTIDGDAIIEIGDVNNPDSGTYEPAMSFFSNGDDITFIAELGITNEGAELTATITDAPVSVSIGDTITVDYEIENVGDESGDDVVEFIVDGTKEDSASVSLAPGEIDTGSFSYTTSDADPNSLTVTVTTSDDSASETVTVANAWSITIDPNERYEEANHVWSTDLTVFDGDIETITVEYPPETDLGGLDESNVVVELSPAGVDGLEEATVGADSYSGSSATFDLVSDDTTLDGEAIVEIEDVTNPDAGEDYEATITLDGANDTITATVLFDITDPRGPGGGSGPPGQQ